MNYSCNRSTLSYRYKLLSIRAKIYLSQRTKLCRYRLLLKIIIRNSFYYIFEKELLFSIELCLVISVNNNY